MFFSFDLLNSLRNNRCYPRRDLRPSDGIVPYQRHKLSARNDESDRLGRLINDLLDLSRIEAGIITWRTGPVSLNDVINASVDGVLPLARNKGLQLKTAVEEPLPSVHGSRDRLVQVVTNLLSNAVKFTPGGGTVTVGARCETGPGPQLVVTVSDSGAGIPAEDIALIFDKFHRSGDELTTRTEGTGLGLTIARQIIEHHGGRIWATSTYGAGSVFSFSLPLDRPCTPADDAGDAGAPGKACA